MSRIFFLIAFLTSTASLDARAAEDPRAWEIRICQQTVVDTCPCPEDCVPVRTDFAASPKLFRGQCYRCAPSSDGLKSFLSNSRARNAQKCPEENNALLEGCGNEWLGLPVNAGEIASFPSGCGYNWKGFQNAHFQETLNGLITTGKVACGPRNYAMCTSATFLYFVKIAKRWLMEGKISEEQFKAWTRVGGKVWLVINAALPAQLPQILKDLSGQAIGESVHILKSQIPTSESLRPGDLLQFWRKQGSGHSVVFQGYLKNAKGKPFGICYWSANVSTKGYGRKCEALSEVVSMNAARFP